MADTSTCTARRCGAVTPGLVANCPTCGAQTVTSRRIRLLGWLLVGCGIILVGLMGYITLAMYPTLIRPGEDVGEAGRFAGTADQARMVLNLFRIVIGFGALCIVNGLWQIVTGRRNILFVVVTLLAAAALIITAWETTTALEQGDEGAGPGRPVPLEPAPDKPQ
ncbi:MAG: hypothetical protein AB7O91_07725 [Sphingomonas sp.]